MPEEKKLSNSVAAVLLTLVVVALIVGAAKSGIDYGKQQAQQPPEVMQAVRLAEQMPSSTPWALDYRIQSGRPVQQQPQAMQQQQMAPYEYVDQDIPPHYPRGMWSRYDMEFAPQARHLANGGMVLPDNTYVPPYDDTAALLQNMQMQNRLFDYYVNGGQ